MATSAEGQLAFEGSSNDFQSLEAKIYRAIELLKEARSQKAAAELELASVREMLEGPVRRSRQPPQPASGLPAGALRSPPPRGKAPRRRGRHPRRAIACARGRSGIFCRVPGCEASFGECGGAMRPAIDSAPVPVAVAVVKRSCRTLGLALALSGSLRA